MVKLKAATLLESLIAMVIIMVCIGIGTMVYANVLSADKQRSVLRATLVLDEASAAVKKSKRFIDERIKQGDYIISKIIKKYEGADGLVQLQLIVSDDEGRVILLRNELIRIE